MRSILIEISPEECRHEERHHSNGLAKARQLRLQSHIRLIVAIAVDCQIRSLHSHHRAHLRRYALFIVEPLAEHHRFTCKQNRWLFRIHRFVHATDAISGAIDGVADDTAPDDLVSSAIRYPGPAKP